MPPPRRYGFVALVGLVRSCAPRPRPGALRALVLVFSTAIHVYNCIFYGRAARIRRS